MQTNKLLIIFLLMAGISGAFAQEKVSSENWKWKSPNAELKIKLGQDTISLPPSNSPSGISWWQAFGYPELDQLTELALAENKDLKLGESRVQESRARVRYARSFLYPSLSFNPTVVRQEYSANRPLPFDMASQSVINNTYALPVDLSYEVDITGKIGNGTRASAYGLEASRANQESLELSIAAEVAKNYAMLLTLDAERGILENTLTTRKESLEIVEARYSAGLVNEIDYQRAKTEYSSVAVQLKNNQLQRTDIELALATLCGQQASDFSIPETEFKYLAPDVEYLLPQVSALRRPDVTSAEMGVESYKYQLKSKKKELYPSLYLDGSLGLLSGQSDQIFENDSKNWLIGATLSVPLFEGGRRRAQQAISEHQLEGATAQLEQIKLQANKEVERALSDLSRINEQLTVQQEFLSAAQKAAELSRQRYGKGLVTYLEVVDAERIVLEAERLLAQLLGQQLISTINLIEATGGKTTQL